MEERETYMIAWLNRYCFGTVMPLLLILAGLFYGIRLRFFPLRHPKIFVRTFTEKKAEGDRSPFRALTLALAGTLGVGNMVGVSAAIAMGGFGSVFWMWIGAVCAMLLKYAEIVLAMGHRRYDRSGRPHGAAMYYIRDFFAVRGHKIWGGILAGIFALFCILNALTMGSMIQVHAVVKAFQGVFRISPWITGTVLAIGTGMVFYKGTDGMLKVTEKLVPFMTLGYLILSVAALAMRANAVPAALLSIVQNAFSFDAAMGGIGGFLLSSAVRYGVMRGLISNEAGCGTAPAAHATSSCTVPAKQGVWGIFEVFADTVLLCTVTALVIIVGWNDIIADEGDFMMMTISAYAGILGDFAGYFMAIAVLLFGFATVVCWAHYGMESIFYFSDCPRLRNGFGILYIGAVWFGSFASSAQIWEAADLAVGVMTLINVPLICLMSREVKEQTEVWLRSEQKSGKTRKKHFFS